MSRLFARALAVVVLVALQGSPSSAASDDEVTFIVGFREPTDRGPGDDLHGGRVVTANAAIRALEVRAADARAFEERASRDLRILFVERDRPDALSALLLPNDARLGEQWALGSRPGIEAPAAWDVTRGSLGVVVAVLDSGLQKSHPDIGNYLQGHDFLAQDDEPDDRCGHGTHVSGIIGALADNGEGIAGVALATLLPVKVLDLGAGGCSGTFAALANGITWSTDQGAAVISMSLGCSACSSSAVTAALEYAAAHNVLSVCAAGNGQGGPVMFPASDANCVAVAAVNADGSFATYSSRGPKVEIAAPGTGILSTYNDGGYAAFSGTSLAAPHVSGVAALVAAAAPGISALELRQRLRASAINTLLPAEEEGAGLVNACTAVGGPCAGGGEPEPDPEPQPPALHTHALAASLRGKHVLVRAYAYDAAEGAVDGVTVQVQICRSGAACVLREGVTASDGDVQVRWSGAGSGVYTSCVTGMTKTGYDWDMAAGHAANGNCATAAL
ncbi:MAG: S8 family serine peptidase [Euryarchaeota archaeon]|nr:S8 family serine peptidase [Euryarchaeota archaeon]